MCTVAIIAEFNPFHNGHAHIIKYAKNVLKADNIIVIMSGDFVQRGDIATYSKWERSKMALLGGVDLVVELPVRYATSTAPVFAYGAVKCANALNCIDYLLFGCEKECLNILNNYISGSVSFDELNNLTPNAILGSFYITALKDINSKIIPKLIPIEDEYPSATTIRSMIKKEGGDKNSLMPDYALSVIESTVGINDDTLDCLMYYAIEDCIRRKENLSEYLEVSTDLEERIRNKINNYKSFKNFAMELKHKNIALTRVRRALFHILLGLKKSTVELSGEYDFNKLTPVYYLRVLALNKEKGFLLKNSKLPVITKLADGLKIFKEKKEGNTLLNEDIFAANLYDNILNNVQPGNNTYIGNEYKKGPVIM